MKEQIENTIEMISGLRDDIKADSMIKGITAAMMAPLIGGMIDAVQLAGDQVTVGDTSEVSEQATQFTENFTNRHTDAIPAAVKDGVKLAKQILKGDGVPNA